MADVSGSRAYERFTGNQIAKIIQDSPVAYDRCERISLISSMLASLLLGRYAPIDQSDASGMNCMDIRSRRWSPALLQSIAGQSGCQRLEQLLGKEQPVAPHAVLGTVSSYFVQRHGFSRSCRVIPFTGDNPSTVAGLGLSEAGDVIVSLGTSDTVLAVVPALDCKPSGTEGHILTNPCNPASNLAMLCFKNGSLAREVGAALS